MIKKTKKENIFEAKKPHTHTSITLGILLTLFFEICYVNDHNATKLLG